MIPTNWGWAEEGRGGREEERRRGGEGERGEGRERGGEEERGRGGGGEG